MQSLFEIQRQGSCPLGIHTVLHLMIIHLHRRDPTSLIASLYNKTCDWIRAHFTAMFVRT